MSLKTEPFFIVGCGRSGTQALAQLFSSCESVEMHHEYMVHHVQPLGAKYYHGKVDREYVLRTLSEIYKGAVNYSVEPLWGDSSNKLSWMISELLELFPSAKFIHIVRDGRKVTSSLYHKLGQECLDDQSVRIFREYLNDASVVSPPLEKKYWWPQERTKDTSPDGMYLKLNHYGRIAYHWNQINLYINQQFASVPAKQRLRVRLEDITTDKTALYDMMNFIGVEPRQSHFDQMQRPHNVVRPENNLLTEAQLDIFWKQCSERMEEYGYMDTEEYELNYHPSST